jgi:hypothetical protein
LYINGAPTVGSPGTNITVTNSWGLHSAGGIKTDAGLMSSSLGVGTTPSGTAGEITASGTVTASNFVSDGINLRSVQNTQNTNITTVTNLAQSASFPSGTALLFQQTSAPTGWTKVTTHNDKALRVVSGSAGSGGSVAFSTAFASQSITGSVSGSVTGSVGATTLSESQIPSHVHVFGGDDQVASAGGFTVVSGFSYDANSTLSGGGVRMNTYATGGSGSHTHGWSGSLSASFSGNAVNLAVNYVDVIIATKD